MLGLCRRFSDMMFFLLSFALRREVGVVERRGVKCVLGCLKMPIESRSYLIERKTVRGRCKLLYDSLGTGRSLVNSRFYRGPTNLVHPHVILFPSVLLGVVLFPPLIFG